MKRHATFNDVKVYNVSAGKSLPEWTEEKKKNNTSLRYNEEYRRRIELITDFDMPTSSSQVKISLSLSLARARALTHICLSR